MVDHERYLGYLTEENLKVVRKNNSYNSFIVALVNFSKDRPQEFQIATLTRVRNYEEFIFNLLAEYFELDGQKMFLTKYKIIDGNETIKLLRQGIQLNVNDEYILTKHLETREMRVCDYYPATPANYNFRFQICIMIYMAKMFGSRFSLSNVKVYNGFPIYDGMYTLGMDNPETVNDTDFHYFFMTNRHEAMHTYIGARDGLKSMNDSQIIDAMLYRNADKSTEEIYKTMLGCVVEYFRSKDFDSDSIRRNIYISYGKISRGKRGMRKLSRGGKDMAAIIEANYMTLLGPFPFKIFRTHKI